MQTPKITANAIFQKRTLCAEMTGLTFFFMAQQTFLEKQEGKGFVLACNLEIQSITAWGRHGSRRQLVTGHTASSQEAER